MSVSPWFNASSALSFSSLTSDLTVDVCVVGAGLGGITTALLLQKEGKKVCVLEAAQVGSGQTGRTSAHVTIALDDRYFHLEALHGTEGIRLAAESHQMALDLIESLSWSEKIECDLERVNGYLFLDPKDPMSILTKELAATKRAGITSVYAVSEIHGISTLPGPALCFPNQLQFHPLKFLEGLVKAFVSAGGAIYTHTPVLEIRGGKKAHVTAQNGHQVKANAIVVATNSPINDLFAIHSKQAAYRSYVISARVPKGSIPKGLYWDTPDPYHYVRIHADESNDDYELIIVGGEDHKTGQNADPENAYPKLETWMRERFPMAKEITHQWSGQVMEPVDGLAFLGHNPMDKNNVYVITGDSGNGMTHCMIGAMIITDQVLGRHNPWDMLYQPSRINLRAIKDFIKENSNVAAQYGDWFTEGDVQDTNEIPRGSGAVIRRGTKLIAAYRDTSGRLSTVSASCPHLGGIVRWNAAEKTWDCPCHGSRFDGRGKVIEGPACTDLKPVLKEDHSLMPLIAPKIYPDINSTA